MDATFIFAQFMSGLTQGMMLFLIAAGLSLIFGVMNILNFAHAALWLVGAYVCYSFWNLMQASSMALWISIPLAALTVAAVGWVIEVVLIKRIYQRELHEQLLLTYAMALIFGDLIKLTWGGQDKVIVRPALIQGPVQLLGAPLDSYFIFVLLMGAAVAVGMPALFTRTSTGPQAAAICSSMPFTTILGFKHPFAKSNNT